MIPTPGRIVAYTLSADNAAQINRRRDDASKSNIAAQSTGAVVHFGNTVAEGEVYPLVITRTWGRTDDGAPVNGQVLLDGNDTLWVTSVAQGDGPRQWHEFPRIADLSTGEYV